MRYSKKVVWLIKGSRAWNASPARLVPRT